MNPKNITRIVLLAIVGLAVGGWAIKEFAPAKNMAQITRPDGVTVINFHGEKRCRTCISIGNLARKTLDEDFAEEEKAGMVHWAHTNFDEAANAHFVKDYGLVSSSVVVTLWKGGKEVKWKELDAVWDHVGDEPTFRAYLAKGIRELLDKS